MAEAVIIIPILTTMPPTTIASSSSPPGDADLQELYNQVLSAFAEESSPSNFSPTFSPNTVDHDPPYSQHNDEPVSSYISTRQHTQSRGKPLTLIPSPTLFLTLSPSASASPRDNNRPLPSPTTYPTSPTQGKGRRPLPRLPGASPTTPSTYPSHMPEARPFFHDPNPPASSAAKPPAEQCVLSLPSFLLSSLRITPDLDDSTQQPSPWETALPHPLQSALPRAAYLQIHGLATKHPLYCVRGAVAPLMRAHLPRPDTRVERVHSAMLCQFLMLPHQLLERTANHGMHRPLVGADTATAFNPPGVPRRGRHLTDPRAPLLPAYLAMPAMIPQTHHHQSIAIP